MGFSRVFKCIITLVKKITRTLILLYIDLYSIIYHVIYSIFNSFSLTSIDSMLTILNVHSIFLINYKHEKHKYRTVKTT